MSIGGIDLIRRAPIGAPVADLILRACRRRWPLGAFQDVEAEEPYSLQAREHWFQETASQEFFIFRDNAAAGSWTREGAVPANANTMLHFLLNDVDEGRRPYCEVTVVCDEVSAEIQALLDELDTSFQDALFHVPVLEAA